MVWDARLTVTDATRTRLGPSVGVPRAPVMLVRSPQAARSASAARVKERVRRGCMLPPTGRASGGTLAGARAGHEAEPGVLRRARGGSPRCGARAASRQVFVERSRSLSIAWL